VCAFLDIEGPARPNIITDSSGPIMMLQEIACIVFALMLR